MPICLIAGARSAVLAAEVVTLVWTHSVEKTEWRETWGLAPSATRLVAVEARVKGSGAGMEPGPGARLVDGWWVWRPDLPPVPSVRLARSDAVADWRLCSRHTCSAPDAVLPGLAADAPVEIAPCP